ncbi:uncharacterized protein LOC126631358 [Malus sylvestris]|uniref:uncharacterized protein LOC126631358 n=1 Tax=Malus sylvestris TaxID=3752 RepID=UPI0021ACE559|nr:uncharacterized protein LOC126631358 [Malus sylvestris]
MYSSQFQAPGLPVQHLPPHYVSNPYVAHQASSPVAFAARTTPLPSVPQQEFWLLDSGATNHMTSDISNLQAATPYPSNESVTGANGQGHQQGTLPRTE